MPLYIPQDREYVPGDVILAVFAEVHDSTDMDDEEREEICPYVRLVLGRVIGVTLGVLKSSGGDDGMEFRAYECTEQAIHYVWPHSYGGEQVEFCPRGSEFESYVMHEDILGCVPHSDALKSSFQAERYMRQVVKAERDALQDWMAWVLEAYSEWCLGFADESWDGDDDLDEDYSIQALLSRQRAATFVR